MDLRDSTEKECRDSYERTMKIVGDGLDEINRYLSQLPPVE